VVYRAEFSSAHHFTLEKRTNKYALTAPPAAPADEKPKRGGSESRKNAPVITPHMRIACFKGPHSSKHTTSEILAGRATEPPAHREVHATLRRLCVALLKRVNDKCRSEDVLVQRLCLYFAVEPNGGPVHLLFGDRMDLRLPHVPSAAAGAGASAAAASEVADSSASATTTPLEASFAAKVRRQAEEQGQTTFGSTSGSSSQLFTPAKRADRGWQS